MKEAPRVEIKDKILLTVEEAAAYSGISETKIAKMRQFKYLKNV